MRSLLAVVLFVAAFLALPPLFVVLAEILKNSIELRLPY